jgi:lysyl-tRNA synthetase class 2
MTTRENTPAAEENALIAERRAKLARLRETGVAFPNDFRRDALAADLHATYAERTDEWLGAHPCACALRVACCSSA